MRKVFIFALLLVSAILLHAQNPIVPPGYILPIPLHINGRMVKCISMVPGMKARTITVPGGMMFLLLPILKHGTEQKIVLQARA